MNINRRWNHFFLFVVLNLFELWMRTSGCCFLSKSVRYVFESATMCGSLIATTMKINMPSESCLEFTWHGPRVNIISEFTRIHINLLHAIALFVSACYWQILLLFGNSTGEWRWRWFQCRFNMPHTYDFLMFQHPASVTSRRNRRRSAVQVPYTYTHRCRAFEKPNFQ